MQHWHEVKHWLRELAQDDVVETGGIRPTLVAFAGERPLLCARWRPFERGGGHAALIELLTLAMPLGADRLAVSVGGNAWSYADRSGHDQPYVGPSGQDWPYPRDDRRQVLMIAVSDDTTGGGRPRCTLTPFTHGQEGVRWGDPLESDEVEGWLVDTLAAPHQAVPSLQATVDDLAATAMRCVALGHELYFPRTESDIRVTSPGARAQRTPGPA
jgi:hypothetical protein